VAKVNYAKNVEVNAEIVRLLKTTALTKLLQNGEELKYDKMMFLALNQVY
jgi:hypothetical protein